jgi:predicted RNase H-like nuclease (RuvC/YqgF family)
MRLEHSADQRSVNDNQLQRQVFSLQQTVQEKEQESALLKLKCQNANEQIKRLETELDSVRSVKKADIDYGKLSQNVTGLTKKLKEQVSTLMDPDIRRLSTESNIVSHRFSMDGTSRRPDVSLTDSPPYQARRMTTVDSGKVSSMQNSDAGRLGPLDF